MEKKPFDFALEFREGSMERFQPGIDDDGTLRIQPIQAEADGLSKAPFETVAHDRRAELTRNRETDSGARGLCFAEAEGSE